jgi:O-antigen/teichoic acid export membrane protein
MVRPQAGDASGNASEGSASADAAELGRRHVRGSSFLLAGRVLSLVLTTTTQVVLVRALTLAEYGAFAYALALVAASSTLLSLGQGQMLSRFAARYEEQRQPARMLGAMALAMGTVLVVGSIVLLSVVPQPGFFVVGEDSSQASDALAILILLAPLDALDQIFVAMFAVLTKPRAIFFRKYLLTPLLRLAVVLALVTSGSSLSFLATGYVVAQVVGVGLYVHLLLGALRARGLLQHLRARRLDLPFKEVLTYSVPTLSWELVTIIMTAGSVLVLQAVKGLAAVAGYRAVFPAARLNQFLFAGLVTLFLPSVSRLHARGDVAGVRSMYWSSALLLAVCTFPIFALTGPFASATTYGLFGERYVESAPVLSLLATGYYLNIALGYNAFVVQMFGRLRYLFVVNVCCAATSVCLALALAPSAGPIGVAAATCTTLVLQNMLYQVALVREIGGAFIAREMLRPYMLLVGTALALTILAQTTRPGLPFALACSAIASTAVLFACRRSLRLASVFPELTRVPVLRHFIV